MPYRTRMAHIILLSLLVTGCSGGSSTDTPGARPTVSPPGEGGRPMLGLFEIDPVGAQASATAPDSVDAAGNPVSYDVANVLDGDLNTEWRIAGDGTGIEIVLDLGDAFKVHQVCLIPGSLPSSDQGLDVDLFFENRRIISAELDFADGSSEPVSFGGDYPIPGLTCFTMDTRSTNWVRLRIDRTTEHGGQDFTAISEIEVWGYVLVP